MVSCFNSEVPAAGHRGGWWGGETRENEGEKEMGAKKGENSNHIKIQEKCLKDIKNKK